MGIGIFKYNNVLRQSKNCAKALIVCVFLCDFCRLKNCPKNENLCCLNILEENLSWIQNMENWENSCKETEKKFKNGDFNKFLENMFAPQPKTTEEEFENDNIQGMFFSTLFIQNFFF